jgi:hypothetical protein
MIFSPPPPPPVRSLQGIYNHPALSKVIIIIIIIYVAVITHSHYLQEREGKSKIITWHMSVIGNEVPLFL